MFLWNRFWHTHTCSDLFIDMIYCVIYIYIYIYIYLYIYMHDCMIIHLSQPQKCASEWHSATDHRPCRASASERSGCQMSTISTIRVSDPSCHASWFLAHQRRWEVSPKPMCIWLYIPVYVHDACMHIYIYYIIYIYIYTCLSRYKCQS